MKEIYDLPDGERAELIDGQLYMMTDKGCCGAPDWITEIVSPGSRRMDYFTKLFKYRASKAGIYGDLYIIFSGIGDLLPKTTGPLATKFLHPFHPQYDHTVRKI